MAEFKPGDKVRHSETAPCKEDCRGVVKKISDYGNLVVSWSLGDVQTVNPDQLLLDGSSRPLVGSRPKVELPAYVAPFQADGNLVKDDTGAWVIRVRDYDGRGCEKFASYVAEALNEKVNREAA